MVGSTDTATIFYEYAKGVGRILIPWNATINPNPAQPFTVECWANSTGIDIGTLFHSMIAGDNAYNGSDRRGWSFRAQQFDLKFVAGSTTTANAKVVTAPGVVVTNTWQHFVAAYNGSNVTLFADGVQVASQEVTNLVANYASQHKGVNEIVWFS